MKRSTLKENVSYIRKEKLTGWSQINIPGAEVTQLISRNGDA